MRFQSVVVLAACAIFAHGAMKHEAAAGEKFPYVAYVVSDDVHVRSGPGKNYYPTDRLSKGDTVEIYRHDPGGWYAIRPPEGSFCWVQAEALKPIGDRIAVVIKDRTPCFVGTRFSNVHDVHQVRLDQGEEVEILDVKQIGEGDNAQAWCHIAPPSGEFRWVHGKFVNRELPPGLSSDPRVTRRDADLEEIDNIRDRDVRPAMAESGWRSKDRPAEGASESENVDRLSSSGKMWKPIGTTDRQTADDLATKKPLTPDGEIDHFQAELNTIDLALSKVVAEDPATWEFTALRRKAEASLSRAGTALERGRVRLILNRISRFEDVKRRYDLLNQPGGDAAIAVRRAPVLPVAEATRYDGMGKLTPVVSQRVGAPRYALVNENNEVVSFITPAPGTDLQPFVGMQVGVSGQRGYMPELKKPHVTAQRIDVVDAARLR